MAIATSKRKFYKLLDNLSTSKTNLSSHLQSQNTSTTSLANPSSSRPHTSASTNTTNAVLDRPSKRSRFLPSRGSGEENNARPASSMAYSFTATAASEHRPVLNSRTTSVRIISSTFGETVGTSRIRGSGTGAAGTGSGAGSKQATYAPWSHEQFIERLKTFAEVRTWSAKPEAIGEVVWAKRGWVVVDKEEVGCRTCGMRVVMKLKAAREGSGESDGAERGDRWWMGEAEKRLVEKYEGLVVEGHDGGCLWRKSGCEDDIYRIRFSDQNMWKPALEDRYNSLLAVESSLPSSLSLPESTTRVPFDLARLGDFLASDLLRIEELPPTSVPSAPAAANPTTTNNTSSTTPIGKRILRSATRNKSSTTLPEDNTSTPSAPAPASETLFSTPPTINPTALALALCGWTGQDLSGVHLAYCTKCFQRIGLWLYKSASSTAMTFSPTTLHRSHCPWQNPVSQAALGAFAGLAAWQVQVLLANGLLARREGDGDRRRRRFPALGSRAGHAGDGDGDGGGAPTSAPVGPGPGEQQHRRVDTPGGDEGGARPGTGRSGAEASDWLDGGESVRTGRSSFAVSTGAREDGEREEKARGGRLARLKRALTVKKGGKRGSVGS